MSSVMFFLNPSIPSEMFGFPFLCLRSRLSLRVTDSFFSSVRVMFRPLVSVFSHTWWEEYVHGDMALQRNCQVWSKYRGMLGPARPLKCLQAAWMANENTQTVIVAISHTLTWKKIHLMNKVGKTDCCFWTKQVCSRASRFMEKW